MCSRLSSALGGLERVWKGYRPMNEDSARVVRMSHPDPNGPPDRTPIRVGEVWENPVNRERITILERCWDNPEGRATAELTALVERELSANTAIRRWWRNSPCSRES